MSDGFAFATLVTSNQYLPGALTVVAALKEVHPSPPQDPEVPFKTVCLVTPETVDVETIKFLRKAFDLVVGVEPIEGHNVSELQLLGRPDLHSVLTKIHVFRLTQFEKIIFLDADILPIKPLSHLFTLPYEFSAVPDVGWPDIFNSGFMVLTPGEDKFNEIRSTIQSKGSWDGGDQGVLNEWRGTNWNRLSFTYNTTPTASYTYAPAYERFGSQISAIHFIGPNKPWNDLPFRAPSSRYSDVSEQRSIPLRGPNQSYGYSDLVDRWFDVYDRNYRLNQSQNRDTFIPQRYENAWDQHSSESQPRSTKKDVFDLEELRNMALKGSGSTIRQAGEGTYVGLPLEGRVDLVRPKRPQSHLPTPIGASGVGGFSNAWDSIPSIQKYASRLAKPFPATLSTQTQTLTSPRQRRRSESSYRSRGESDANSMDGDVEDEIDESDEDTGTVTSSGDQLVGATDNSIPPTDPPPQQNEKKEYRSYGVQTLPKSVRSVAVQVRNSVGNLGSNDTKKTRLPSGNSILLNLPRPPSIQEMHLAFEQSAITTPSSTNIDAPMSLTTGKRQENVLSGTMTPRLHDMYTFETPSRMPLSLYSSIQPLVPEERGYYDSIRSTEEQNYPAPSLVTRTSSQETADSSLGPISPADNPLSSPSRRLVGRTWDPKTGVDIFKRGSEEVLARFLRMGSWEETTANSR